MEHRYSKSGYELFQDLAGVGPCVGLREGVLAEFGLRFITTAKLWVDRPQNELQAEDDLGGGATL